MGFFTPSHTSRHSHYSSSSYYRRRPRDGYINRMILKLRRLLRELIAYARRHPVKVFMLVVMPLVTGGALHGMLRQLGIRIPAGGTFGRENVFNDGYSGYSTRAGFSDLGGGGTIQNLMRTVQAWM